MSLYLERPLVIGGSGQLGTALREALEARGVPASAPTRAELAVSDIDALERAVAGRAPSIVLNAAAFTDVAAAERAELRSEVFRLNVEAPAALARTCARLGIPLVHVSTDYVFDGRAERPYREDDPVHPIQVYGESKLAGERSTVAEYPQALIVRTSTLFGPARRVRPNYVDAILAQAVRIPVISVVELPVASPTYAPDLAAGILALVERGASGLFHLTNGGACSRLELAQAVVELAGRSDAVRVEVRAPVNDGVARPAYSALDVTRFAERAGFHPRPWRAALADHLRRRS